MHYPDWVAVILILIFWVFVDGCVIVIDREDDDMYRYLTNQVWLGAIAAKTLLIFELFRWRKQPSGEGVSLLGWITSVFFLIIGAAQFGVLAAFFLLVWLDSTLLDNMLESQQHSIAEIIAWNHLRHVTVCFVHLALTWSLRHYLSRNAETEHTIFCDIQLTYGAFCCALLIVPIVLGLLHSALFDDQKLYRFGSIDIGSKCQLAFGLFSFVSAVYFLCVPLRSSRLERKHENSYTHNKGLISFLPVDIGNSRVADMRIPPEIMADTNTIPGNKNTIHTNDKLSAPACLEMFK